MQISQLKAALQNSRSLEFRLPDGKLVEPHFHITEAGVTTKHFIDCGGTIRLEKRVNLQLWHADDVDHRLSTLKLLGILRKAEPLFQGEDLEVEVEYQADTICRYGLSYQSGAFMLQPTYTDCLALDQCGIPPVEQPTNSGMFEIASSTCAPGSGCC